jgi:oligopeptide/dipeptide ABC transporter ATP-binding protein
MSEEVLRVEHLDVAYHAGRGRRFEAVRDVSFSVGPGEIVGIVGESGCGKSTLSASLMRLLPENGEITAGSVWFRGRDVGQLGREELRALRGSEIAMIFQDPLTSLNPTFTIGAQMLDAQRAHQRAGEQRASFRARAVETLEQVGIPDPSKALACYPHEFSGGMRQRIMIAIALLLEPALLIADEPTSALDVTLEAQVLELLRALRDAHETALLLISHDLGVVAQLCDRVVVMYAGRAVEQGDIYQIYERPHHPYTRALLDSMPSRARSGERLRSIPGRVPSLSALPAGCAFAPRCPHARPVCQHDPEPTVVDGVSVRCHMHDPASGWEHGQAA